MCQLSEKYRTFSVFFSLLLLGKLTPKIWCLTRIGSMIYIFRSVVHFFFQQSWSLLLSTIYFFQCKMLSSFLFANNIRIFYKLFFHSMYLMKKRHSNRNGSEHSKTAKEDTRNEQPTFLSLGFRQYRTY